MAAARCPEICYLSNCPPKLVRHLLSTYRAGVALSSRCDLLRYGYHRALGFGGCPSGAMDAQVGGCWWVFALFILYTVTEVRSHGIVNLTSTGRDPDGRRSDTSFQCILHPCLAGIGRSVQKFAASRFEPTENVQYISGSFQIFALHGIMYAPVPLRASTASAAI